MHGKCIPNAHTFSRENAIRLQHRDTMSGWDAGRTYTSNTGLRNDDVDDGESIKAQVAVEQFRDFIRSFAVDNSFLYRDALRHNYNNGEYHLDVRLEDVASFRPDLAQALQVAPADFLPHFEEAARYAWPRNARPRSRPPPTRPPPRAYSALPPPALAADRAGCPRASTLPVPPPCRARDARRVPPSSVGF